MYYSLLASWATSLFNKIMCQVITQKHLLFMDQIYLEKIVEVHRYKVNRSFNFVEMSTLSFIVFIFKLFSHLSHTSIYNYGCLIISIKLYKWRLSVVPSAYRMAHSGSLTARRTSSSWPRASTLLQRKLRTSTSAVLRLLRCLYMGTVLKWVHTNVFVAYSSKQL